MAGKRHEVDDRGGRRHARGKLVRVTKDVERHVSFWLETENLAIGIDLIERL